MLTTGSAIVEPDWEDQLFDGYSEDLESDPIAAGRLFPIDNFAGYVIQAGLQGSTISVYLRDIYQYFSWLGTSYIKYYESTRQDVIRYLEHLTALDISRRRGSVKRYAPSTLKRKLSSIRVFYGVMISMGIMFKNPALGIQDEGIIQEAPRSSPKVLSTDQVRDLFSSIDLNTHKGYRDRAVLALMVFAGLESFEVRLLNTTDFSINDSYLYVSGRAGKKRKHFLPKILNVILISWINPRQLLSPSTSALIISLHRSRAKENPGNRISNRGLYEIVRGSLESVGLKETGHCARILRNTFKSLLLDKGSLIEDLHLV